MLQNSNDMFLEWARKGYQAFVQPSTVEGVTLNDFGWVDNPTNGDLLIPMYSIRGDEEKTMYWINEKIICNSASPVRFSLEGNFDWDEATGTFAEDGWKTIAGYMLSSSQPHNWTAGLAPIKTVQGEALRLRVFTGTGNTNDFYFKFVGLEVPFVDDGSIF